MALKLSSDGGFQISESQRTTVVPQLRDAQGPEHIPIDDVKLLLQMVRSIVSRYPPGGEDSADISSTEPLTPYFVTTRAAISPPTSSRRVALLQLLKLATYRILAHDFCQIGYFGYIVLNNDIKVSRSIKRDASQFADPKMSMDRQNIWVPDNRFIWHFCAPGLASAVRLLVQPAAVRSAEVMDIFRHLAEFFEVLDCRASVPTLV